MHEGATQLVTPVGSGQGTRTLEVACCGEAEWVSVARDGPRQGTAQAEAGLGSGHGASQGRVSTSRDGYRPPLSGPRWPLRPQPLSTVSIGLNTLVASCQLFQDSSLTVPSPRASSACLFRAGRVPLRV